MLGKGAGVRVENRGLFLGKVIRENVSEKVTSERRREGGERNLEEELSK